MAKDTCSIKRGRSPYSVNGRAISKALVGLSIGCISFSTFSESGFTPRAVAQLVPDNTLGAESSQVIPNVLINGATADQINGGAMRGSNLFHSFSQFNIGDGQRAYFANPTGIENILTRVTGADPSAVLGTIGVDGTANLFLLNPNGIYFGPNARLDMGGSFFAGTAGSLRFADGTEFSAVNPQVAPLLTVNVPIGAQLQTTQPLAAITNRGDLTVPGDLTLVGSNLDLQGHLQAGRNLTLQAQDTLQIRDTATNPFLASAGETLLVQGNQGIDIFALNHPDSGLWAGGNLTLRSDGQVIGDAHYQAGGDFQIETLNGLPTDLFSPNDPIIRANGNVSFASYFGTSLHILAGGSVAVTGTITITGPDATNGLTETVTLSDGTSLAIAGRTRSTLDIRAGTAAFGCTPPACGLTGTPSPGTLTFPATPAAPSASITLGTVTFTNASANANGLVFLTNRYNANAATTGNIQVNRIDVRNGFGNSSNVVIDSRGGVTLNGAGLASQFFAIATSNTASVANGNGGTITVLANNDITINDRAVIQSQGILGGAITLNAGGNIVMNSSSTIASNSVAGTAGNTGGAITLTGNTLTLRTTDIGTTQTTLSTATQGQADAGAINLNFQNGTVALNSASIFSETRGSGASGLITVNAQNLAITSSLPTTVADTIRNAQLLTQTFGTGAGGNLNVTVTDATTLDNGFISSLVNPGTVGRGGAISLTTRTLSLTNSSQLTTRTASAGNAGTLDVVAAGDIALSSGSALFSQVGPNAAGQAGAVTLRTSGNLTVGGGTDVFTRTFGSGNASDLNLIVDGGTTVNGGSIFSATAIDAPPPIGTGTGAVSTGRGGNVTVTTGNLLVANAGRVLTQTETAQAAGTLTLNVSGAARFDGGGAISEVSPGATGAGGNVVITAPSIALANGGAIQAITGGAGSAGGVTLTVADGVTLDGVDSSNQPSRITSQVAPNAQGNGNNVEIAARNLALTNGAQLGTTTFGQGRSGDVSLRILDTVSLTGESANGGVSSISAQSGASGAAGNLTVQTRQLTLLGGGQVTTTALDTGRGGNLTVSATESVNVSGSSSTGIRSGLFASSQGTVANAGSGGSVEVTTPRLTIGNGAQISASTAGSGQAGNIVINTRDLLELDGTGTGIFASTATGSSGQGGSIFIDPIQVSITNNARISVSSLGSGNGGSIFLQGGDVTLDRGFITAETASGEGGNITVRVGDVFLLRNGSLVSATAGGTGNGGNLDISARFIVAPTTENSDIIANAFQGRGGNVLITTDGIFGLEFRPRLTPLNDITASSEFGLQGVVTIVTPNVDPSKGVVSLPGTVVDASQQIAQGCRPAGEAGRFVATGRGGLPPVPGETIGGDALWEDVRVQGAVAQRSSGTEELASGAQSLSMPTPAHGWVMDDRGNVTLVAQMPKSACY